MQNNRGRRRGICWTLTSVLEDLDYADDVVLLSHLSSDMQDKIENLEQIWTLGKGSAKPGPSSYSYGLCGEVESIVGPQKFRSIRPAYSLCYFVAQSAGG